jgi:hypothetical protein
LLLYSSHLALGVSNWPVIYFINYTPTSSLALFITAPSVAITIMHDYEESHGESANRRIKKEVIDLNDV